MARTYRYVTWKTLTAKHNAFAEIKELAAAELGKLAGMLTAQPRTAQLFA